MTGSDVTTEGLVGARPDREALTGAERPRSTGAGSDGAADAEYDARRARRRRRAENSLVAEPEFKSYYGLPVLNEPTWKAADIAGYLFLGGLAGASSVVAAGAQLSGRKQLERGAKVGAGAAIGLSLIALVHDLGRPSRFINMLRVFKPTSPMSVGSWLLTAYAPAAMGAAASELTGLFPPLGAVATAVAALTGPGVASYTAALIADTAVPGWHDGYRELPFVFVSSASMAAAGLGLLCSPLAENAPVQRLAVMGAAAEVTLVKVMEHRMGMVAEAYHSGKAGKLMRASEALAIAGGVGALTLGRRSRLGAAGSGLALMAASACTRFGVFAAGVETARDPKYTVGPQRERLERLQAQAGGRR